MAFAFLFREWEGEGKQGSERKATAEVVGANVEKRQGEGGRTGSQGTGPEDVTAGSVRDTGGGERHHRLGKTHPTEPASMLLPLPVAI